MSRRLIDIPPRERWRRIGLAALRVLLVWVALGLVYYYVPLEDIRGEHPVLLVGTIVGLFGAVFGWSTYRVFTADVPQLRAAEAVGFTLPLFLTLFAILYLVQDKQGAFSVQLDRISAIYFTVTVFATVGFGDITPTTAAARLLVSLQMMLDLIILGVVVKVIFGAARRGLESAGKEPLE